MTDLYLYEDLLLLALHDEQGTVRLGVSDAHAMAGALLAELVMMGRLKTSGESLEVEVVDGAPIGDALLDQVLDFVRESKEPKPLRHWLSHITHWKNLRERVADQLCDRGLIERKDETVFFVFKKTTFPELDGTHERTIVDHLRRVIFEDVQDVDARTVMMLSLAFHTRILEVVFDSKELAGRKQRIQSVIQGDASGEVVATLIQEMQMAAMLPMLFMPVVMPMIFK